MPYSNLSEIMSAVTFDVGRRDDLSASDVSRIVNDAYLEVASTIDPEGLEKIAVSSTTTGENKISLPTDFYEPISAALIYQPSWSTLSSAYSSYNTLRLVSLEEMDANNPQPSGVPRAIAFFADWMELYPSPNSAYSLQLRYRSGVTDMIAGADVPSVGTPWRKAIKLKAEEGVFNALSDPVGAADANMRYLRYVSQLRTDAARRQSGQFRQHVTAHATGGRRRV